MPERLLNIFRVTAVLAAIIPGLGFYIKGVDPSKELLPKAILNSTQGGSKAYLNLLVGRTRYISVGDLNVMINLSISVI